MSNKKITPKQAISRLQDLIGRALAAYDNDRNPNRADLVKEPLKEAFDLCVKIRARWKV